MNRITLDHCKRLVNDGLFDEAVESLNRFIAKSPNSARALELRATAHRQMERREEELSDLRALIHNRRPTEDTLKRAAEALIALGRKEETPPYLTALTTSKSLENRIWAVRQRANLALLEGDIAASLRIANEMDKTPEYPEPRVRAHGEADIIRAKALILTESYSTASALLRNLHSIYKPHPNRASGEKANLLPEDIQREIAEIRQYMDEDSRRRFSSYRRWSPQSLNSRARKASEHLRMLYKRCFGRDSAHKDLQHRYESLLDALHKADISAAGISDVSPEYLTRMLDALETSERERIDHSKPGLPRELGMPIYQNWQTYKDALDRGSTTPLIEREGPAFALMQAREWHRNGGVDIHCSETVQKEYLNRSTVDLGLIKRSEDSVLTLIANEEIHLLFRKIRTSMNAAYPQEKYWYENDERNLIVQNAMKQAGLTIRWSMNKNRTKADGLVIELMEKAQGPRATFKDTALLTYQRIAEAMPHLQILKKSTPAVAEVWTHTILNQRPIWDEYARFIRKGEIVCLPPPVRSPADIVRQMRSLSRLSNQQWRYLARLQAGEMEEIMQKARGLQSIIHIHAYRLQEDYLAPEPVERLSFIDPDTERPDKEPSIVPVNPQEFRISETEIALCAVALLAAVSPSRKSARSLLLRQYALGVQSIHFDWRTHLPLIRAYSRQADMSATERGCNMADLNTAFLRIMDWANTQTRSRRYFRHDLIDPMSSALAKSRWNEYKQASDAWHARIAREKRRTRELSEAEGTAWTSALGAHKRDNVKITPLTSLEDLEDESAFAGNCIGESPHYTEMGKKGLARYFRLSTTSRIGIEQPMATVQLSPEPDGSWRVEEVEGPRYELAPKRAKRIAQNLAARYSRATARTGSATMKDNTSKGERWLCTKSEHFTKCLDSSQKVRPVV